jgi:hypothetical protein
MLSLRYTTRFCWKNIPLLRIHQRRLFSTYRFLTSTPINNPTQTELPTLIKSYPQDVSQNEFITSTEFADSMTNLLKSTRVQHTNKALKIGIAISGGRDSMALAILVQNWFKQRSTKRPDDTLNAVIIDHRMRPESTLEANTVKTWLEDMGIGTTIKQVDWETGALKKTMNQKAARDKRFELIFKWCEENAISLVLMGHHLQDSVETMIYRLYVYCVCY